MFQCVSSILSGIDSPWPITMSTVLSLVWLVDGWGTALERRFRAEVGDGAGN